MKTINEQVAFFRKSFATHARLADKYWLMGLRTTTAHHLARAREYEAKMNDAIDRVVEGCWRGITGPEDPRKAPLTRR